MNEKIPRTQMQIRCNVPIVQCDYDIKIGIVWCWLRADLDTGRLDFSEIVNQLGLHDKLTEHTSHTKSWLLLQQCSTNWNASSWRKLTGEKCKLHEGERIHCAHHLSDLHLSEFSEILMGLHHFIIFKWVKSNKDCQWWEGRSFLNKQVECKPNLYIHCRSKWMGYEMF